MLCALIGAALLESYDTIFFFAVALFFLLCSSAVYVTYLKSILTRSKTLQTKTRGVSIFLSQHTSHYATTTTDDRAAPCGFIFPPLYSTHSLHCQSQVLLLLMDSLFFPPSGRCSFLFQPPQLLLAWLSACCWLASIFLCAVLPRVTTFGRGARIFPVPGHKTSDLGT